MNPNIYPVVRAQQNLYGDGIFLDANQVYPNRPVLVLQPLNNLNQIILQNPIQIPAEANFPPGTRVGRIEFIGPDGAPEWFDASDFIMLNYIEDQEEVIVLVRTTNLDENARVNIPFQYAPLADNPVAPLNDPAAPVDRQFQTVPMHASCNRDGPSNMPVIETLSPPNMQMEELIVANNEIVMTSADSPNNDQRALQEVLNQQEPAGSGFKRPRTMNNMIEATESASQKTLPLQDQVRPMEVAVAMKMEANDSYCWVCHLLVTDEDKVNCRCACGLVFHEQCKSGMFPLLKLPVVSGISPLNGKYTEKTLDSRRMTGKCKECINIAADALYNNEFGMNLEDAFIVFSYAVTRLMDKEFECFEQLPTIGKEIVKPMDLNAVLSKANRNEYRSIEEFMFDIKLIIHNAHIINSIQNDVKFTNEKFAELTKAVKIELNYIDMCYDCYRIYYESTQKQTLDSGADIPCPNPHSLVWAKKDDNQWFPAKVYEYRAEDHFSISQHEVSVIFLGFDQREPIQVKVEECLMYSKKYPTDQPDHRTSENIKKSQYGLIRYLRNLKILFITKYKVQEFATRFDWNLIFLDLREVKNRKTAMKKIRA